MKYANWSTLAFLVYGSSWQTALSVLLRVSDRTVRNWCSKESDLSREHACELQGAAVVSCTQILASLDSAYLHHGEWSELDSTLHSIRKRQIKLDAAAAQVGL